MLMFCTLHTVEPHLLEFVWTVGNYIVENYDPEHGINVDQGTFQLPAGPGLGVTPDETRIGALTASYG